MLLASIAAAIDRLRRGGIVVVVDDEDRENEGDLIIAAEHATPDKVAFVLRHTSGLLCVAVTAERADELRLPLMVPENTDPNRTAFTVTVDRRELSTTGISAVERSATTRALADPATRPEDLTRPGHVHVLRARPNGVLRRAGHTEAAVDLTRLAGLHPAGLLCEVTTEDKLDMARRPELERFAARERLPMISVADLVDYRWRTESLVTARPPVRLPTAFGDFTCIGYRSLVDGETHLALVVGEPAAIDLPPVRVHSECLTGEAFGSRRCDCGEQLAESLRLIARAGHGVLVYLRGHEGRAIGLANKLSAYRLQEQGRDSVDANLELGLPADARHYGIAAQILRDLGVTRVRLLSNNPAKLRALEHFGVEVAERVALECRPHPDNVAYLRAKRARLGHLLDSVELELAHGLRA